jgi:hypothetical protein
MLQPLEFYYVAWVRLIATYTDTAIILERPPAVRPVPYPPRPKLFILAHRKLFEGLIGLEAFET